MEPDRNNARIDLFADVDFKGLYTTEDKMDPVSIKSRTRVLLNFGNISIDRFSSFNQRFLCLH